jgi:hypothetical protein
LYNIPAGNLEETKLNCIVSEITTKLRVHYKFATNEDYEKHVSRQKPEPKGEHKTTDSILTS